MISVSGQLQDQSGTPITSNAWVRFNMRYLGGNQPYVAGTALVSPAGSQDGPTWYKDFAVDGSGNISGSLYSTSEVTVGGLTGVIAYGMVVYRNGQPGPESIVSAGGNININNPNILNIQPVSVAPTGDTTYLRLDASNSPVIGSVQFKGGASVKSLGNVRYVDASNTAAWAGSDVGAWINAAYADLPARGGTIYIAPKADSSNYDFSTPIVFNTAGKYVLLEALGASNSNTSGTTGSCLNYVPTTATTAITLDYVSTTGSPLSSAHGLRNVTLINNNSGTKGGSGSSAVGIGTGLTNAGCYEAVFDNVSVTGFGTGYKNLNDLSVQIHWIHPKFSYNAVAVLLSSITDLTFSGGQMAGNGTVFKTNTTTSTPEVALYGTSIFNNSGLIFDATASTVIGTRLDGFGAHFENSPSDAANYISGKVDVHLFGGVVEDDNTVGTNNWFFSVTGEYFYSQGVTYSCSRTCTQILLANAPVRGTLGGHDRTNGHFTAYIGGANAAFISNQMSPGPSTVAATPATFEWIKAPTVEVGTGSGFIINEDGAPSAISGKDVFYGSSVSHRVLVSCNNGSFDNVVTAASTDTLSGKTFSDSVPLLSANGATWTRGQASELLTLSTSGTTTDTSANLLPANSIIDAVVARVTTTITTATDWKLGDATQAARFSNANAVMTTGTTQVGLNHADPTVASSNLGPVQTSAAKVRVTCTGTPGAGVIRLTVFYRQFVAPTS